MGGVLEGFGLLMSDGVRPRVVRGRSRMTVGAADSTNFVSQALRLSPSAAAATAPLRDEDPDRGGDSASPRRDAVHQTLVTCRCSPPPRRRRG